MIKYIESRFEIIFDCEGEPPKIFIAHGGECCWVEVLEEPKSKTTE